MVRVESDKSQQLVTIAYSNHVSCEEIERHLDEARRLVQEMEPGFRFLTDLSKLESMDAECAPLIAQIMEAANEHGIGEVLRVVPDPKKDIGFTLMSRFHYDKKVRQTTFESLEGALQSLAGN